MDNYFCCKFRCNVNNVFHKLRIHPKKGFGTLNIEDILKDSLSYDILSTCFMFHSVLIFLLISSENHFKAREAFNKQTRKAHSSAFCMH